MAKITVELPGQTLVLEGVATEDELKSLYSQLDAVYARVFLALVKELEKKALVDREKLAEAIEEISTGEHTLALMAGSFSSLIQSLRGAPAPSTFQVIQGGRSEEPEV